MVIVQLKGGLGNQMFQYACGLSIALKRNSKLFLDTSFLRQNKQSSEHFTARKYELDLFKLSAQIAKNTYIKNILSSNSFIKLLNCFPNNSYTFFAESDLTDHEQLDQLPPKIYLSGYWQSEYYFKGFEEQIRKEFAFTREINATTNLISKKIQTANAAVSIHLRRGDYVTSKVANSVHGVCTLDYYQKAIELLCQEQNHKSFYIFSDDPDWTRKNLIINEGEVTYVSHNLRDDNWQDMYMMSLCRYHIIANSSFSWWGAWLSQQPNKIVIAPKDWFNDPEKNKKSTTIVPNAWTRI